MSILTRLLTAEIPFKVKSLFIEEGAIDVFNYANRLLRFSDQLTVLETKPGSSSGVKLVSRLNGEAPLTS